MADVQQFPSDDLGSIDLRKLRETVDEVATPNMDPSESKQSVVLVPRRLEIEIIYVTPEGIRLHGVGYSQIKTGKDRLDAAKMAAGLAAGLPWAVMPPISQGRIWGLANVTVQLQDAPEWVYKWVQEDDDLLTALVGELEAHEARYFRRYFGESSDDSPKPKLVVRPADASSYPSESDLADPTRLVPSG
jgi:hypothetical protein